MDRIYVTDWCSATPEMRYLSIDNYLADLNVAVDEIGAPVDLIGLCQGGWLSLIYAARFPAQGPTELMLAGAPVDVSVWHRNCRGWWPSVPKEAFDELVHQGEGIVSGKHTLRFWSMPLTLHDVEAVLQRNLGDGSDEARMLLDRFERWDRATLDLPGAYYLEVTDQVFPAEPDRAKAALSRSAAGSISPRCACRSSCWPARDDIVVPRDQAFATARLLGTPPAWLERACEPCGHLSLFMGRNALSHSWRRVARWLQADIGDVAGARISA